MEYIINPNTFEKHLVFSDKGKELLKKLVKSYQQGGMKSLKALTTAAALAATAATSATGAHNQLTNTKNITEVEVDGTIYDCFPKQPNALGPDDLGPDDFECVERNQDAAVAIKTELPYYDVGRTNITDYKSNINVNKSNITANEPTMSISNFLQNATEGNKHIFYGITNYLRNRNR